MSNQQIADRLAEKICSRLRLPLFDDRRTDIRSFILAELEPQPVLQFADKEDRTQQRTKVLSALKKAGRRGCLNTELNEICLRYGARIYELRGMGYKIKTEKVGRSLFNFTLAS